MSDFDNNFGNNGYGYNGYFHFFGDFSPECESKIEFCLSISLIIFVVTDVVFQFLIDCFNAFFAIDDAALLILAIIYIVIHCQTGSIRNRIVFIASLIIFLTGGGLRIYAIYQIKEDLASKIITITFAVFRFSMMIKLVCNSFA